MCCCCEVMHIRCWKTSSFRVYYEEMREKEKTLFRRWLRAHETSSSFQSSSYFSGEIQHHQQQQKHQQQHQQREEKEEKIEFNFFKKEIKKPQRKHEKSLKWEKKTFVIWELLKNKENFYWRCCLWGNHFPWIFFLTTWKCLSRIENLERNKILENENLLSPVEMSSLTVDLKNTKKFSKIIKTIRKNLKFDSEPSVFLSCVFSHGFVWFSFFSNLFSIPFVFDQKKEDPIYHDDDVFFSLFFFQIRKPDPIFTQVEAGSNKKGKKITFYLLIDRLLKLIKSRTCNLFSSFFFSWHDLERFFITTCDDTYLFSSSHSKPPRPGITSWILIFCQHLD